MDFMELAGTRYSVRDFRDTPVEQEKLDRILEAARIAPTAANKQPQKIYVLKSENASIVAAHRMLEGWSLGIGSYSLSKDERICNGTIIRNCHFG